VGLRPPRWRAGQRDGDGRVRGQLPGHRVARHAGPDDADGVLHVPARPVPEPVVTAAERSGWRLSRRYRRPLMRGDDGRVTVFFAIIAPAWFALLGLVVVGGNRMVALQRA